MLSPAAAYALGGGAAGAAMAVGIIFAALNGPTGAGFRGMSSAGFSDTDLASHNFVDEAFGAKGVYPVFEPDIPRRKRSLYYTFQLGCLNIFPFTQRCTGRNGLSKLGIGFAKQSAKHRQMPQVFRTPPTSFRKSILF